MTDIFLLHRIVRPGLFILLIFGLAGKLPAGEFLRLFVGTYTGTQGAGEGIYTCRFDPAKTAISEPELAAKCDNPSYLAIHPTEKRLYTVGSRGPVGFLYAFIYDKESGKLDTLDEKEIPGRGPCHLALCRDESGGSEVVVVANYGSGSVVSVRLRKDGTFDDVVSDIRHEGEGPNAKRQNGPHPHGVFYDAKTRTVAIPDLGIDRIVYYGIDLKSGLLTPWKDRPYLQLPPGGGPRHAVASKNGRFVYTNNELTSTVCVFDLQGDTPIQPVQETSTLPPETDGSNNTTSAIRLSPDGKFLYVSNRGHDSIAVFAVDGRSGRLSLLQTVPSGGRTPRFFTLDPTGKFLFSCNQDSGNTVLFTVDETGIPRSTGQRIEVSRPVCIVFAP